MNYRLLNNHYVVDINGYHFIIDTGSPKSFSFRNDLRQITINNVQHGLDCSWSRSDIEKTHQLVGYPVDGLLGKDVFGRTGLTFYRENESGGRVEFATHHINGDAFPFELMNDYAIFMRIDNNKLYLVDTGARYGYGAKSMFNGLTSFDNVWDFNPYLKDLYSPIYNVEIQLNNKKRHTVACYNEHVAFNIPNFLMVGNITDLFERECCIDYINRRIIFN